MNYNAYHYPITVKYEALMTKVDTSGKETEYVEVLQRTFETAESFEKYWKRMEGSSNTAILDIEQTPYNWSAEVGGNFVVIASDFGKMVGNAIPFALAVVGVVFVVKRGIDFVRGMIT